MPVRQVPGSRAPLRAAAALALASLLGPGGCHDPTAPLPLPSGAVRFVPPPAFARWWAVVEACSGRTGEFAAWAWYQVPAGALRAAGYGNAAAYTDIAGRRIVMNAGLADNGGPVRHEMLHALLGRAYATGSTAHQHPPVYFQERCAGVVYCPDEGCGDAGPPPLAAPAGAPTLPLAALNVTVEVIPGRVSSAGADRDLTIVVRATNPTDRAGWVPLEATSGAPAPSAHWMGFRVVPAGQPLPVTDLTRVDSTGIVGVDPAGRVPFAAGQTRWRVFDMSGALYPPGDYRVVGVVNTRQVAAPLTVTP